MYDKKIKELSGLSIVAMGGGGGGNGGGGGPCDPTVETCPGGGMGTGGGMGGGTL